MMENIPEWVQVLLGAFSGGAGVYAAIRADMAALRARMDAQELHSAETRAGMRHVHERIDAVVRNHSVLKDR